MGLFDFLKFKKESHRISFYTPTQSELNKQSDSSILEIKKLCESAIPSKNGLRPHEIMMLSYAPKYYVEQNDFPRFWYYDFAIEFPQLTLAMLLKRGFIRVASPKESLSLLQVADLKNILLAAGIKPKTKKVDLIQQIHEHVNENAIERAIIKHKYALTDLGVQELSENEYVLYFGNSVKYGISVWQMNKMIQRYPHNLYRDLIWSSFNNQIQELLEKLQKSGDIFFYYKEYSSIRYQMCDFLIEENRSPETALEMLAEALYYDIKVSSVFSYKIELENRKYRESGEQEHSFVEISNIKFHLKDLPLLQNILSYSLDELESFLSQVFSNYIIHYEQIRDYNITELNITDDSLAKMVVALSLGDSETAEKFLSDIERQIKKDKRRVFKSGKL